MTTVDWIILIAIVLYALFGWRRGFVATVVYTIGSLVSFWGAAMAASRLNATVGAWIAPYLSEPIARSFEQHETASGMWGSVSGYLQNILEQGGLTLDILEASESPQQRLADAIAACVGDAIAYLLVFLCAFVLIKYVVRFVASAIGIFTHLPILHTFDALLGGLLGAATGLVLCTCVLWVLKLTVPAMYSDYGALSPAVMEQSAIARHLVGWNDDSLSLFEETA